MAVGTPITAADYNQIRDKIVRILGSGSGQFGYGQPIISSAATPGTRITAEQWNNLRYDIVNARVHQRGVQPILAEVVAGNTISYTDTQPAVQYLVAADFAVAEKFNLGPGQFVVDAAAIRLRDSSWSKSLTAVVTASFSNADQARFFFNTGGQIRFASGRSGGASTSQNQAWSQALAQIGAVSFSAVSPLGFYDLTSSYQTLYSTENQSTYLYSQLRYRIRARANIDNNDQGGATTIYFEIYWEDNYTGSSYTTSSRSYSYSYNIDSVDGRIVLAVDEVRASGILLPEGTGRFDVVRPTYTASDITGS